VQIIAHEELRDRRPIRLRQSKLPVYTGKRTAHEICRLDFGESRCNGRQRSIFSFGRRSMTARPVLSAVALGLSLVLLTGCGNTIRGVGRDLGNAVDATQDAGRSVVNSVK
jgi:predicted small secreted protein